MTAAPLGMCISCWQQLPAKLLDQSAADMCPASPVAAGMLASGQVLGQCTPQIHPASQSRVLKHDLNFKSDICLVCAVGCWLYHIHLY